MSTANKESVLSVLGEVPATLRALVEENAKLASENDAYKKRDLAEEIVAEMDKKGLGNPDSPFREKVAALLESGKDLEHVKTAIDLATPNLSFASVSDEESSGDDFIGYILGQS